MIKPGKSPRSGRVWKKGVTSMVSEKSPTGNGLFAAIPHRIIDEYGAKIGPLGLAVLIVLIRHADKDGCCYPTHDRIARLAGMSTASVKRALAALSAAGLVAIESNAKTGHRNNYRLTFGRSAPPPQLIAHTELPLAHTELPTQLTGTQGGSSEGATKKNHEKKNQIKKSQEEEEPPHPPVDPIDSLADEFCDTQTKRRSTKSFDDKTAVAAAFGELMRRGFTEDAIRAEIINPARSRNETLASFINRVDPPDFVKEQSRTKARYRDNPTRIELTPFQLEKCAERTIRIGNGVRVLS